MLSLKYTFEKLDFSIFKENPIPYIHISSKRQNQFQNAFHPYSWPFFQDKSSFHPRRKSPMLPVIQNYVCPPEN